MINDTAAKNKVIEIWPDLEHKPVHISAEMPIQMSVQENINNSELVIIMRLDLVDGSTAIGGMGARSLVQVVLNILKQHPELRNN